MAMAQSGWVWEGIGFDPGVLPTVYGVGEGVRYFDVPGANFIFHPTTRTNLAKLAHAGRVTADISKWVWFETKAENGRFTFAQTRDDAPATVAAEAEKLSLLSREFQKVVGAYIDDTFGVAQHATYTRDSPRRIKEAVRRHAPLDLWIVVYTHELDKGYWDDWIDEVDVVSLWIWDSSNLPRTTEYVAQCRKRFPRQRINMGMYIRDYSRKAPVELAMLESELDAIRRLMKAGDVESYGILGACLIDQHPEQAELIRDYIRGH